MSCYPEVHASRHSCGDNIAFKPKAWAALYLNHALEKFNCDKLEFLWLFSSGGHVREPRPVSV